jgi:hypothetical protein
MKQHKNIDELRFILIALLFASGVCLIAAAWPILPRNLGDYLWLAGCVAIGIAGWLIPHRFTAGMFVGVALLAQFQATVAIYQKCTTKQPRKHYEVSARNDAGSRTLARLLENVMDRDDQHDPAHGESAARSLHDASK